MTTSNLGLPVGTTLDRFIKRNQEDFPFASGELSQLLRDIALAGKILNKEINRAGLGNILGDFGETNVQGENQQKLDVVADIRFTRALKNGGEVCAIVSEENEEIVHLNPDSKYLVAIDPLDGSSNIDVNVSIGTIFSIYRRKSPIGSEATIEDVLQPGSAQVAAGYLLYGSSTMLVYTTGNKVNGFTYDPSLGEFFLSHRNMTIPKDGKIFSINEGYYDDYESNIQAYIEACKRKKYSARYIGSLVGDFHRNLLKGGIYIYPTTKQNPQGKLRLLYECNALAFIAEQAGGKACNGLERILDIQPQTFHQRTPLLIGSPTMVDEVLVPSKKVISGKSG
ncbi:fructose-1,6-bisphosphatase I [Catalinimonas alkaloidigena]|uniref:class 1 fructose-bisphosphatase n=1 Tax=Catalinimonas alkaloidigena TaxID=1075417 RepID=UPI0024059F60|nr:class 1 fructose-bisphosphatase [Catalinimonas alkaloidigena]MDF9798313.1 fructose-1,6-bisphosphatase I [Catalinimonas alkaloidigena]